MALLERLRMGVRSLALPALALGLVWLLLLRQPGVWPGADGWVLGALALALALWARQRCSAALAGPAHAQDHAHCVTVQAPAHARPASLPTPRLRWRALDRKSVV